MQYQQIQKRKVDDNMPYAQVRELQKGVKNSLPKHAQDIYKEAFNSAYDQNDNYDSGQREESAHRIAWSAVKKKYERNGSSKWQKK